MAITESQPQASASGLYQTDTIEKETHLQEMENADVSFTPKADEDPDSGKLNKEIIMAYIVCFSRLRTCQAPSN
jgi:hypothetical protein